MGAMNAAASQAMLASSPPITLGVATRSAVYGSDAVAGVINFVLRRDYRGAEVGVEYGTSTQGGGAVSRASVLWGHGDSAVDGDHEGWRVIPATIYRYYLSKRTHFWASASTSQSGGLYKKAREFEKDPTKAWDVGAGLVHHF
jgi:hypothetical protein